jgi:hypothetical protein
MLPAYSPKLAGSTLSAIEHSDGIFRQFLVRLRWLVLQISLGHNSQC